ncbi:Programmed cell death protein 6 [Ascosphaera aggregata]|nr:Programmed cell death protein 6 [Ascosphaera aggregata]
MASFNPDRLPAHAEPEQAAQILGKHHIQAASPSQPPLLATPSTATGTPPPRVSPAHAHHAHLAPIQTQSPPHSSRVNHFVPNMQASSMNSNMNMNANSHRPRPAGGPGQSANPYGGVNYTPNIIPYGSGNGGGNNSLGNSGAPPKTLPNRRPVPHQYPQHPSPLQHSPHPQPGTPVTPIHPRSDSPPDLLPIFRAANTSKTGLLTERELGAALVNGDFTAFDPTTVSMMIRMFCNTDAPPGQRTVDFEGFVDLWKYLASWRHLFVRFDTDRSGRISMREFENALSAFGFRLSTPFVAMMYSIFETRAMRRSAAAAAAAAAAAGGHNAQHQAMVNPGISFDLFVQAVLILKKVTDSFKQYDTDRDGYVTLSFEEFLTEILNLMQE